MDTDRWAQAAGPLRARLVRRVADAGLLTEPAWRAAFAQVPRHLFVPCFYRQVPGRSGYDRLCGDDPDPRRRTRWLTGVYEDAPLVTRVCGGSMVSSSSQPSLMAAMLEALEVRVGHEVLEIGAGSGYNAALLAHRLGASRITTVDLDPGITAAARAHLDAAGTGAVAVVTGDGSLGCHERAPYDRIIATCEVLSVPWEWLRQCVPGALVLAPLAGGLIALRVTDAWHAQGCFLRTPAYFVALRGPGAAEHPPPRPVADDARVRRSRTPPRVLDDDVFRFVFALAAGQVEVSWAYGGRGAALTAADGSSARVDRDGLVEEAGERDLWALAEDTYRMWRGERYPERDRFGVSVDGDRQWAWLDVPDGPHSWELTSRT